jgi:hypothetical protein
MPATVNVNMRTVVHSSSSGMVMGFPDVCKTPSPAGPIPIPYPNIAMSSDTSQGSSTVKCDGNPVMIQGAVFSKSNGDEAGVAGGVVSNTNMGKAEFILYSFDVKFDGKNVCRMADLMMMNKGPGTANTPPFPEIQPPNPAVIVPDPEEQDDELESIEWIE